MRAVDVLEKLPDVSVPGLVEVGRYRMVSEPTLAVLRARVSQLRGTGHTNVAKRGRSWLGIDRRGHRSLKGVRM